MGARSVGFQVGFDRNEYALLLDQWGSSWQLHRWCDRWVGGAIALFTHVPSLAVFSPPFTITISVSLIFLWLLCVYPIVC